MINYIRVFLRKTDYTPRDKFAIIGKPTEKILDTFSKEIPVAISVVYTWDVQEGLELFKEWKKYFKNVKIGGCGFKQPSKGFISGEFIRKGVVYTSRGCNRHCAYCYNRYEGKLREYSTIEKGWSVWDANLLQCSDAHIIKVFNMLRKETHPIIFSGGFDMRLFNEKHLELLNSVNTDRIYFATDVNESIEAAKRVYKLLANKPKSWRNSFTLCGFNGETIQQAKDKIKKIKDIGFVPKVMLFQTDQWVHYSDEWLQLKEENIIKLTCFQALKSEEKIT